MPIYQFKGLQQIVNAYINRGVPSFAVWYGKYLLFPYPCNNIEDGQQALTDFLESISKGSNVAYTLKVYEDLDNGKIKEKTQSDGSFLFYLESDEQKARSEDYKEQRISGNNEVISRLAAIEAKMEGGKIGSGELSTLDHIKDFCDTEAGKIAVPQIVGAIISMIMPGQQRSIPMQQPALGQISGITPNDGRITQAIVTLKKHDAKLDEHLEKLATLAETNPQGFQSMIAILDQM